MSERPITTAAPRRPFAWRAWASLGSVGAGLALAVGRYVFLPLPWSAERWKQAVLVGAAASLMITGWRGWRVARSAPGGVRWSAAGLGLAALPALVVLAALAAVTWTPAEQTQHAVELPGIEAVLPGWEVRAQELSSSAGEYVLGEPGGSGFVELRWAPAGAAMTSAELLTLALAPLTASGARIVDRRASTVGGHQAETVGAEMPPEDLRLAVTAWSCPQDHRALWIITLLHRPASKVRAFHERLLSTVRCHTGQGSRSP